MVSCILSYTRSLHQYTAVAIIATAAGAHTQAPHQLPRANRTARLPPRRPARTARPHQTAGSTTARARSACTRRPHWVLPDVLRAAEVDNYGHLPRFSLLVKRTRVHKAKPRLVEFCHRLGLFHPNLERIPGVFTYHHNHTRRDGVRALHAAEAVRSVAPLVQIVRVPFIVASVHVCECEPKVHGARVHLGPPGRPLGIPQRFHPCACSQHSELPLLMLVWILLYHKHEKLTSAQKQLDGNRTLRNSPRSHTRRRRARRDAVRWRKLDGNRTLRNSPRSRVQGPCARYASTVWRET